MEITVSHDTGTQLIYTEDLIARVDLKVLPDGFYVGRTVRDETHRCTLVLQTGAHLDINISAWSGNEISAQVRNRAGFRNDSTVVRFNNYNAFYEELCDKIAECRSKIEKKPINTIQITVEKPKYAPLESKITELHASYSASRRIVEVRVKVKEGHEAKAARRFERGNDARNILLIRRCLLDIKDVLSRVTGQIEYYASATKLAEEIMAKITAPARAPECAGDDATKKANGGN